MNRAERRLGFRAYLKKLLQYFFQGLIVLAPIGITIWVVLGLFNFVDDILPNIIHTVAPTYLPKDAAGNLNKIPGLGFIVVIVLVLLVGWLSSLFVGVRLVSILDSLLEKTPGIKFIYSSVMRMMCGVLVLLRWPIPRSLVCPDMLRSMYHTLMPFQVLRI